MELIEGEPGGPLPESCIEETLRLLSRRGAVALSGAPGSGRHSTASALISRDLRRSPVKSIDANFVGTDRAYGVLIALELVAEAVEATSPTTVARILAERTSPLTIIIDHAEHADAMSLRALAIAVRKSSAIRVILTVDTDIVRLRGWRDVYGIPLVEIEPLDRDGTIGLVERLLGARPAVADAHLLSTVGAGSFRAIRWLIELSRLNDGVRIDHGRVGVRLPSLAATNAVPSWSLDPTLVSDPAAQLIALAESVPLSSLGRLGIADNCLDLERAGVLRTTEQVVEFATPALAYDVAGRMGAIEKRRGIEQLLEGLEPDELGVLAAGTLWHHAVSTGLEPSDPLTARAIVDANSRGQHAEALRIAERLRTVAPEDSVRLAFASVMTGAEGAAVNSIQDVSSADDIEAAGLALAVGELRYGQESVSARGLDNLVKPAPAASAAVLRAYATLVRPGQRMDEDEIERVASDINAAAHTRARAFRALALRAWMDGRPVRAAELVDEADRVHRGSAVDAAISLFLRASSELLRPDYDAAVEALLADIRPGDASIVRTLVGSALGIFSGTVPLARMYLQTLIAGGDRHDPVLEPLTWSMLSITHSMLGNDAAARDAMESAYGAISPSLFVTAAAHHVHGIAITQLAVPEPDEGLAALSAAVDASAALDFRLLFSVATYRTAMALDEHRRVASLKKLSALREGDRPLDGVPRMLAELADALANNNIRQLIDIVARMRRAGLLQDAKVLSARILSSTVMEVPSRVRRGIAKLAHHRFDTAAPKGEDALTARELEVARLLLARLTDREIAEQLDCAPRTASVHVGRILRKFDVSSRQEITTELLHRSGTPV